MKNIFLILVFMIVLLLSACTGSIPGVSKQGHSGVADWNIKFDDNGQIESARIIDGKEKANVAFDVDLNTGIASYSAKEVKAFEGQKARAILEAEISEDVTDAFPGIINTVIAALEGGL
ncbi:hypothetical protein [Kiloniella sp. EL199]|uniref:hypothetical protein n=1 Tax=Kiloniella sp. EL199 TaxID=2107581 RepID=UPI000EA22498|nr:hypothetical protein [Kiloniella sp. EL199]